MKLRNLLLIIALVLLNIISVESVAFAEDASLEELANRYNRLSQSFHKNVDSDKYSKWLKLNRQGVEYFNADNYEQAIKSLNKALKIAPKNSVTLTNLGAVYLKMNNSDEAMKFFDEAVEANPDYANAWNMRGVMYLQNSNFDKAIECFNKVIGIDPEDEVALEKLADCYEIAGKNSESSELRLEASRIKLNKSQRRGSAVMIESSLEHFRYYEIKF